jgi:hypothetical protein
MRVGSEKICCNKSGAGHFGQPGGLQLVCHKIFRIAAMRPMIEVQGLQLREVTRCGDPLGGNCPIVYSLSIQLYQLFYSVCFNNNLYKNCSGK